MSSGADLEALERKLIAFLTDDLQISEAEFTRDSPLVSTGLIDSMNLVRLATFLERDSGVVIPNADINADKLDSIARILASSWLRIPEMLEPSCTPRHP